MGGRGGGSGRGGGAGAKTENGSLQSRLQSLDRMKFPELNMGYSGIRLLDGGKLEVIDAGIGYEADLFNKQGKIIASGKFRTLKQAQEFGRKMAKQSAVRNAFHSSISKTVANNGTALAEQIKADPGTLRHTGNYSFTAKVNGLKVRINTRPKGDGSKITIDEIVLA